MERYFNTTGPCKPKQHYMVDLQSRLVQVKKLVDRGSYFVINRARQYGKTTILRALCEYLRDEYRVVSLDFQMQMSSAKFQEETTFSAAFAKAFLSVMGRGGMTAEIKEAADKLEQVLQTDKNNLDLVELFQYLSHICALSEKPIVLMIDEVDSASNNQVFLDFLAQLRGYYIDRDERPTFQSVILAGVYDIKNLKRKIRPDNEHKVNSPWNIAAEFKIDMSFHTSEIFAMLKEYEKDYATGMDIDEMAQMIYEYTSGYPFLVSRLCQLMDEDIAGSEAYPDRSMAWTKEGFLEAVKLLLSETNTLFDSLTGKLQNYPELREMLYTLLFSGKSISYSPDAEAVNMAVMFGFVKNVGGMVQISNRIFETRLYNLFLSLSEAQSISIYDAALIDKNQFIRNGSLDMERILEKFVIHFDELYGDQPEKFVEEDGRRYFLLYLRPIINGVGNYYVEAQTRNRERTDVIVDYHGEQFVIELKIWRGNAYKERGEEQILNYLEYYHLNKGYMLSFNFNKKKEIGVRHIRVDGRLLVEAVV